MRTLEAQIDEMVAQREAARLARDYATADRLRDTITAIRRGSHQVRLMDGLNGPFWYWTQIGRVLP